MPRILVAGAAGSLGSEMLPLLKARGHQVRAFVRSERSRERVREFADEVFIGDALQPKTLPGLCSGVDVVISTMGKSVSLFTRSPQTFHESDYLANLNLLHRAQREGVSRFLYVSLFHSREFGAFAIGRAHADVERAIELSGLSYLILHPVGLFSGLHDVLLLASMGLALYVGHGEWRTNPIHQKDLALLCADKILEGEGHMEIGGPKIYSRREIVELARHAVLRGRRTGKGSLIYRLPGVSQMLLPHASMGLSVPERLVNLGLPMIRLAHRDAYDKLSFFHHVVTRHILAPPWGTHLLEDYFLARAPAILGW